jgi:hypothetical protein
MQWTDDSEANALIVRMLHNYSIKVNEELGHYSGRSLILASVMNYRQAF